MRGKNLLYFQMWNFYWVVKIYYVFKCGIKFYWAAILTILKFSSMRMFVQAFRQWSSGRRDWWGRA